MKARVVLKGAKTYTLGGRRWIKDVPGVVSGEDEVKSYQMNGYFRVTMLESKKPKKEAKAAAKEAEAADSGEAKSKGSKLRK